LKGQGVGKSSLSFTGNLYQENLITALGLQGVAKLYAHLGAKQGLTINVGDGADICHKQQASL
jgi:hypothetical protein